MRRIGVPVGSRFGRWTVLEDAGNSEDGRALVRCKCDCGTEFVMQVKTLRRGMSRKCRLCFLNVAGYLTACPDWRVRRSLTSRIRALINRCHNPANKCYRNYGARGIKVYAAWVKDKAAFLRYLVSLPGHDDPQLTIDRIDNNGNYEPGNIRFATRKTQRLNQRNPQFFRSCAT